MNKRLAANVGSKLGRKVSTGLAIAAITLGTSLSKPAAAIPGQTIDEAASWMRAHPTLRARPSERLSIRRSATPSQRYTFHGSAFPPAGGSGESLLIRRRNGERVMVRSEKFTLTDVVRGVDIPQLEDSLRAIYGAQVFADYRRAQTVMVYSPGRAEDRGTERSQRSHLLEGDLYAYLIEVLPNTNGVVETGAVTVMLREDAAAIQAGMRRREIERREFENPTGEPIHLGPTLEQLLR